MPEYTFICEKCSDNTSLVCTISEYSNKSKTIKCSSCGGVLYRDFSEDNIDAFVSVGLSECKTIGQYAEKQSAKYTKAQLADMKEGFKTKKTEGGSPLPQGMSRMEKPDHGTQWTKD